MRRSIAIILPLELCVGVVALDPHQTSSTTATQSSADPPGLTAQPGNDFLDRRQISEQDTCGFLNDATDDPVTCSSGACGYISRYAWQNAYAACCADDGCNIQTTCIERGTAADSATLACTGRLSRCATYTWPDYNAESYACATTRFTATVETTTQHFSTDVDGSAEPTTNIESTITVSAIPTSRPTGGDNDGKDPGLGSEYDLDGKQRIQAAVGSAVFGALLVGTALVFGCCLGPSAEECPVETENGVEGKNPDAVVCSYQGLWREEQVETQQWNADEVLPAATPISNYGPAGTSDPYNQPLYGMPHYN
ncbi:hypothetical protein B0T10DRAFT_452905 [Thelonectria olida]|uniref:Uncharacterized protein n=1 Tax=Thelonectria olida TaxID=1576542 RepID=A0A9P9ATZ6_9HYPO|nr:hypothetical protein B0T10DRAFT_452905 [Thelonectria olida]